MKNIFKRGLALVLSLLLLTVLLPQITLTAQAASAAIFSESFEDETSLEKWTPSENNTISISDLHAKSGDYSACWGYSADGSLTFTDASCFAEMDSIRTAGIIIWIYNDEAKDKNITFRIGTADEVSTDTPRYRFTFNLNYTGWRTLHIRVAADGSLDQTKSASPDTMRISMPEEITSGQLFIDLFEVNSKISFAYTADYQAPYLSAVRAEYEFSKQQPDQIEDVITASQISDFDIIESLLDQYVFPEGIDFSSLEASPLKTRYQKLVGSVDNYIASSFDSKNIIREEDGRITGTGLFSQDDERSPKFSDFETTWIALLADYKLNGDETSLEEMLSPSDLIITISDPDLRVVDTTQQKVTYATEIIPSQEKELTVTLNGLWNVEGGTAVQDSSHNTTTVTLRLF